MCCEQVEIGVANQQMIGRKAGSGRLKMTGVVGDDLEESR